MRKSEFVTCELYLVIIPLVGCVAVHHGRHAQILRFGTPCCRGKDHQKPRRHQGLHNASVEVMALIPVSRSLSYISDVLKKSDRRRSKLISPELSLVLS